MTSVIVALIALALALSLQRLALRHTAKNLSIREKAFRFHAIRDRLQSMAVDGELAPDSKVYEFLMFAVNVGIRNSGKLRMRDMLTMTSQLENRTISNDDDVLQEVAGSSPAVKTLTGETFLAFVDMIVANDRLVAMGSFLLFSTKHFARKAVRLGDHLLGYVAPERAEIARRARRFYQMGMRFGT
ncbi:MAG: hypothetical protein U5R14_10515 [Gemmatimonadota bacterium]|nr:hypothetical protein [Gemmatimonadota bacterium]